MPHHLAVTVFNTWNEWMEKREKRKKTDLKRNGRTQGVRVSEDLHCGTFSSHLIVVSDGTAYDNRKKNRNKDGDFFQRGSIAYMSYKSGHCFRGGKDPLGGLFVSLKKNLAKCKRKYPESVAGTPKAFQLLRNILNELLSLCRRQNLCWFNSLLLKTCKNSKHTIFNFFKVVFFLSIFPILGIAVGSLNLAERLLSSTFDKLSVLQ